MILHWSSSKRFKKIWLWNFWTSLIKLVLNACVSSGWFVGWVDVADLSLYASKVSLNLDAILLDFRTTYLSPYQSWIIISICSISSWTWQVAIRLVVCFILGIRKFLLSFLSWTIFQGSKIIGIDRKPMCIVYMVKHEHLFDETTNIWNINTEVKFSDESNKYLNIKLRLEYHIPLPKYATYLISFT